MSNIKKTDVLIIGGGVVGAAISRELSKYNVEITLLEKESDVGQGASNSCSGVVHTGYTCPIGSLKSELCVRGNKNLEDTCNDLDVPFKRVEKLVVAFENESIPELYRLKYIGEENGADYELIGEKELERMEPNLEGGKAAIYSPQSAITSPYGLTIAFAENAVENGVNVCLNTEVSEVKKEKGNFVVNTNNGKYKADYIINSAGVFSDEIAKMSGENSYKIYPVRGEYHVLDKERAHLFSRLLYPVRQKKRGGGGIHVSPTVDGNILIGPSDEYIEGKEDFGTTRDVMKKLVKGARRFVPKISSSDVIRSFSGLRSKIVPSDYTERPDFVIKESPKYCSFINLIGIESPGLTASQEIGKYVVNLIDKKENLKKDQGFNGKRKAIKAFSDLSEDEQKTVCEQNKKYAEIVCRCENVTKYEIEQALDNPLGVRTIKGIKYRTRARMGRCQGGFCTARLVEIMKEKGMEINEITHKGEGSKFFVGNIRPPALTKQIRYT